jgi:hypothetical protein
LISKENAMRISPSRPRTFVRVSGLALGVAVVLGTTALPASANSRDVIQKSSCSSGVVKLKLSSDDGRIETEFEVDSNRTGQTWTVRIFHNGTRVAKTTGVTKGRSGSFDVHRLLANGAGPDSVRATATRGSKTCAVSATM